VERLRKAGLSLQRIRKGIRVLRAQGHDEPLDVLLITDGKALIHRENDKLKDVLKSGQLVFAFVAVKEIREQVDREVSKLPRDKAEIRRNLRTKSG